MLAEELPKASEGGKVYTFKFRDGIKYSDGTPLKASDFEHTVKRVLNLESGGAFYYEKIEGAEEFVKAKDPQAADISGIETDDKTGEVKVTLTEPDGTFPAVLGLQLLGRRAQQHAVQERDQGPAPRHGRLRDHLVGAQPPVRAGEEQELRADRRRARGQGRQAHVQDHQEPRQRRRQA